MGRAICVLSVSSERFKSQDYATIQGQIINQFVTRSSANGLAINQKPRYRQGASKQGSNLYQAEQQLLAGQQYQQSPTWPNKSTLELDKLDRVGPVDNRPSPD